MNEPPFKPTLRPPQMWDGPLIFCGTALTILILLLVLYLLSMALL